MSINPFKSRYALTVVVFLAAALAGPSGMATAGEMKVNLSGNQEVPPVQTSASGSGSITVEDDKSIKGRSPLTISSRQVRISMKRPRAKPAILSSPSKRPVKTRDRP